MMMYWIWSAEECENNNFVRSVAFDCKKQCVVLKYISHTPIFNNIKTETVALTGKESMQFIKPHNWNFNGLG